MLTALHAAAGLLSLGGLAVAGALLNGVGDQRVRFEAPAPLDYVIPSDDWVGLV